MPDEEQEALWKVQGGLLPVLALAAAALAAATLAAATLVLVQTQRHEHLLEAVAGTTRPTQPNAAQHYTATLTPSLST